MAGKLPPCVIGTLRLEKWQDKKTPRLVIGFLKYKRYKTAAIMDIISGYLPDKEMDEIEDLIKKISRDRPPCEILQNNPDLGPRCVQTACPYGAKATLEEIMEEAGLEIVDVKMYVGEPTYYEITFSNEEILTLDENEILTSHKFIKWFMRTQKRLIRVDREQWDKFINGILAKAEVVEREEATMGMEIKELITAYLETLHISTEKEDLLKRRDAAWFDGGVVYVPSNSIRNVLKREHITISGQSLAYLLKDIRAGPTIRTRIGGKRMRVWMFKPEVFPGIESLKKDQDSSLESWGGENE